MFTSADGGGSNVVRALSAHADDYVTHPVRFAEFGARVSALLRRAYPANTAAVTELGPYRFDSRQQSVTVRGQTRATERHAVPLSSQIRREFQKMVDFSQIGCELPQ
jgi:DNA-binding response OmpR family regulator